MSLSFGYFREGDRVISVGGREPASVEEAVEGIRLGGRTVHLLVRLHFLCDMMSSISYMHF